jgi:HlyD family secretion protein
MNVSLSRILFWSLPAAAILAGLVYAFWPRAVAVDMTAVARGPLMVTVDEEGETRVRDVFVLSALVDGRVLRIDNDVGDRVVAHETVVARIEPIDPTFLDVRTEAQAQAAIRAAEASRAMAVADVERADADLAFATAELERAKRLRKAGTIAQRALDEAQRVYRTRKAVLDTAKAAKTMRESELERAKARLLSPLDLKVHETACDCVEVRAPVDGRILRIFHESEGVVRAGAPLVEIGDPGKLEIVADLLSADAVKVEPEQRVLIEEWGGPGALEGRVRLVEPYGFTKVSALGIEEQRVNVLIDFADPAEKWQRLGHGYRVEIRVVLWAAAEVLKVPLTALFRDGGEWSVFVEADGRARLRAVKLGRQNGLEAEIVDGLAADERIVLHPSSQVEDGTRIAPRRQ